MPLVVTTPADVRSGNLTIEGNGTVRPKSEISLSPQVAGRVSWVSPSFASGGRFEKGDVLLRIESADYENAVRAAEAEVAQREVELLTWEEQRELAIEEYERFRRAKGSRHPWTRPMWEAWCSVTRSCVPPRRRSCARRQAWRTRSSP